jgi:hypothetical protein
MSTATRRLLLLGVAALALLTYASWSCSKSTQTRRAGTQDTSSIARENMLRGVAHENPDRPAGDEVSGYSSVASAAPDTTIRLFVNVNHEQNVRWDLYRVGYYDGLGTRLVAHGDPTRVSVQPACPIAPDTGLIECNWAPAFDVTISRHWVSGYYFFELVNDEGFGSRVPLILKEGARRAPGLVQASVTTWQAYNRWGGMSLYANDHRDGPYKSAHAHRVSFDRPYQAQNGLQPFLDMIRFLEHRGYDISYTTNLDIDEDATVLAGRQLFMTIAHDEYWSIAQRDALDAARNQGVSLAFFSGNTGYWRIRVEPSTSGVLRRIITCYKTPGADIVRNASDTTVMFRDSPFARPENSLLGVAYRTWSKVPGFPYIVTRPEHWVYQGTGVKAFDALNNVVGPEWDGVSDNGQTPDGLEILADATTINSDGVFVEGKANITVYYPTPKSLVFAGGTIDWGFGLGAGRYADARIERMTENVLARAGLVARVPLTESPPRLAQLPSVESKVLAGSGVAVQSEGAALTAGFGGPSGIAAAPDGKLCIVDRGAQAVRILSQDGQLSSLISNAGISKPNGIAVDSRGTLYLSAASGHKILTVSPDGHATPYAGTGREGSHDDKDPLSASFAGPRGLALGPNNELYVADSNNHAIRRIDASGVTTVATGLQYVSAVAAAPDGSVYFSTIARGQLGVVRDGHVTILANTSGEPGNIEGPAQQARLQPAEGLIAEADRLVFSDTQNNRVRALSLTGTATISTIFGDGNAPKGVGDASRTWLPRGITPLNGGYALVDFASSRVLWFKESDPIR